MAEIKVLVQGGRATPGPPLGPALGPLGVNIGQVVAEINKKTKEFEGMTVPVIVKVDEKTRQFEIIVGSPPTSALIKKELGIEKGSKGGEVVGDLPFEKVVEIAKKKMGDMGVKSLKAAVKNVLGTCVSMGVTVDGKPPKEVIKEVEEGKRPITA